MCENGGNTYETAKSYAVYVVPKLNKAIYPKSDETTTTCRLQIFLPISKTILCTYVANWNKN